MGFAGIRSLKEVRSLLTGTPEISQLPSDVRAVVDDLVGDVEDEKKLRTGFEAFIAMEGSQVKQAVDNFCKRIKDEGADGFKGAPDVCDEDRERLAEATSILAEHNPGDGSIFVSL